MYMFKYSFTFLEEPYDLCYNLLIPDLSINFDKTNMWCIYRDISMLFTQENMIFMSP